MDENVWLRLLEQNAERLRQGSALLAADYGFRSAVHSGDEETIQSVLENHGERIGAAATALLDTDMAYRALDCSVVRPGLHSHPGAGRRNWPQPQGSQIAVVDGVPYQFVMVPMRAPVLMGWVLMGFPLDQALADEMRRVVGAGGAGGARGRWTRDCAREHLPATLRDQTCARRSGG